MRLQKQRSREVKGKEYFRWTVVIPPKYVEQLGWKEGEELDAQVTKKSSLALLAKKTSNS